MVLLSGVEKRNTMEGDAAKSAKSLRLSFLSPRASRAGSFTSGFAGPLSPHSATSPKGPGGLTGRRPSMTVLQVQDTVLRKHLPVLMTAQTHLADTSVPLFLVSLSRFFRDRGAASPGLLDAPLSASDKAQLDKIFVEAVPGSECVFGAHIHPRVVFQAFLTFLRSVPAPAIVTFEVRPLLRGLIKSAGDASVASMAELLLALPTLNKQMLLEVLHIAGLICENSHANQCDPVRVCTALAEVCFASEYSTMLDDGSGAEAGPASDEGKLLRAMATYRKELMFAANGAPPMGQSMHDLLWCTATGYEFEKSKERVSDLAFATDGSLCVVGSSGNVHLRTPLFEHRAMGANAKQPLLCVTAVDSAAFWIRGEMYAELRNASTGERTAKLSRNVRCFLHLPQVGRVWGGSEGVVYVFDDKTGADISSIAFAATPAAPAAQSASLTSSLKRQESEMVDEEMLSNMVSSLSQPIGQASSSQRRSNYVPERSFSGMGPGGGPVGGATARAARTPVRFLVKTKASVWAAGGTQIKVFPLVDPAPPGALATQEEEHDITGMASLGSNGEAVVAVTGGGLLLRLTLEKDFSIKREELRLGVVPAENAPTLRLTAVLNDSVLVTSWGKELIVVHIGYWKKVGVVVSSSSSPITSLASCPGNAGEICVGHDDGTIRKWSVSPNGFSAAATTAWRRTAAPSDGIVSMFCDARTGASINPEEVEVDRSKATDTDQFGLIYRGRWRAQDVAIKELSLESFSKAEIAELVESLEMPKLPHPRWLQLHCFSLTGSKRLVLVTTAPKSSLYALLKEGNMRWRLRMKIAEQVAQYLAFLHASDPPILHLDITASSIALDSDYNVCVDGLYGGLGRLRNRHSTLAASPVLYKSQRVLPPEMLVEGRGPITMASDMYQFGMLLWSLMQQGNPFHDVISMTDLRERVCTVGERPAIPESCPASIREVLFRCWSAEQSLRPTAAELLHADVFARGYLEHSLEDPVAFDFWANSVCRDKGPGKLLEPASLTHFCQQLALRCDVDQKTIVTLEEMFKNFLVYNGMVNVGDFGEMLLRFGRMSCSSEWVDHLIIQLVTPGMHGSISSETAEDMLAKAKRGEYLFRFTRAQKGALQLHVKGSEGVRGYVIVPGGGGQVAWKLKESSKNQFFPTLDDLVKHYATQLNLKTPLENGIFQQVYRRVMGVEKKRGLFAKKSETTLQIPGSSYTVSYDD